MVMLYWGLSTSFEMDGGKTIFKRIYCIKRIFKIIIEMRLLYVTNDYYYFYFISPRHFSLAWGFYYSTRLGVHMESCFSNAKQTFNQTVI